MSTRPWTSGARMEALIDFAYSGTEIYQPPWLARNMLLEVEFVARGMAGWGQGRAHLLLVLGVDEVI